MQVVAGGLAVLRGQRHDNRADKEPGALADRVLTAVRYIKDWNLNSVRLVKFSSRPNDDGRCAHALTEIAGAEIAGGGGRKAAGLSGKAGDFDDQNGHGS